jgi:hypothetical protein
MENAREELQQRGTQMGFSPYGIGRQLAPIVPQIGVPLHTLEDYGQWLEQSLYVSFVHGQDVVQEGTMILRHKGLAAKEEIQILRYSSTTALRLSGIEVRREVP